MVPETMAAVLLTGHGDLSVLDYWTDVPVPSPGPEEVLVEVGAAGLNNTDVWTRTASYNEGDGGWKGELNFPLIQGADVVGVVVDIGDHVNEALLHERVIIDPAIYGGSDDEFEALVQADLIGSERDGGFAEYICVPADNTHRILADLSDAELATVPTSYATAERMLNRGNIADGDEVVVTGASGGVGTGLVQLARRRGATVIAVTSSPHTDTVRDLGADHIVDRDRQPVADAVATVAEDCMVDAVADVVAGDLFQPLLEGLRPDGRYVVAGAIAGPVVNFDLRPLYLDQRSVIGSTMWKRSEFEDLLGYIENGTVTPMLADTYSLTDFRAAQQRFMAGDYVGNLAVEP